MTDLPETPPPASISGDRSMERIRITSAKLVFAKETANIIAAKIKTNAYWSGRCRTTKRRDKNTTKRKTTKWTVCAF
jgi:hypothetical protein